MKDYELLTLKPKKLLQLPEDEWIRWILLQEKNFPDGYDAVDFEQMKRSEVLKYLYYFTK